MKTIIVILICVSSQFSFTQVLDTTQEKTNKEWYDFHIKKKKTNNTAGWITLGGGVAMILGGLAINVGDGILSDNGDKGLWLSYLGGAATVVSIPLFISAGSHKRKAKLYVEQGTVGLQKSSQFTGVTLHISF
jgi:hypothetical protein